MEFLTPSVMHFALVFVRVGAFMSLLPGIGESFLPVRIKLAISFVVSMLVVFVTTEPDLGDGLLLFVAFIGSEAVVGLFLGMLVRLFLLGLQMAGSIAAQATSLSQLLGGATPDPVPAMGYIWVFAGLALASMMGLHSKAVTYLAASYTAFPLGTFPSPSVVRSAGVMQVSKVFVMAMSFSAPFYAVSLIYNLMLGVLNRAMPQLMVAFVGAPLITWASIVVFFVASVSVVGLWVQKLGDHLNGVF